MRLNYVLLVTSYYQLADTVQRLGSRFGSTFVDVSLDPRIGKRNVP